MSFKKVGKVLPKIFLAKLEQDIAAHIAQALRTDFPNIKTLARTLGDHADINMETLKKWYNGSNSPSLAHLVILLKSIPSLLETFLQLSGYDFLIPHILEPLKEHNFTKNCDDKGSKWGQNVPINVPIKSLSDRQNWFLAKIKRKIPTSADDISRHWKVTPKTAKRDIADLKRQGLIVFKGSRKAGGYEMTD